MSLSEEKSLDSQRRRRRREVSVMLPWQAMNTPSVSQGRVLPCDSFGAKKRRLHDEADSYDGLSQCGIDQGKFIARGRSPCNSPRQYDKIEIAAVSRGLTQHNLGEHDSPSPPLSSPHLYPVHLTPNE